MQASSGADVLIVDDAPANLQLLFGMLKERGYRVRPVSSGRMALQAARAQPPDIVLLDVNMPALNGYDVCHAMKQDEELRSIPVIFISALTEPFDKLRAFAAGGVDYITKPFHLDEVLARIETHLSLRRMQGRLAAQNRELAEVSERLRKLEAARQTTAAAIVHDPPQEPADETLTVRFTKPEIARIRVLVEQPTAEMGGTCAHLNAGGLVRAIVVAKLDELGIKAPAEARSPEAAPVQPSLGALTVPPMAASLRDGEEGEGVREEGGGHP